MNVDFSSLEKAVAPLWKLVKQLFTEHHFITIVCGFFVVMMLISCYKFLRSISPALVVLIASLMLAILLMHWTATRTEPEFLTPFVNYLAPFMPTYNFPMPPPPKR